MHGSARLYLQSTDGAHHALAWFKSHRENWLIWSPYGLATRQATLAGEWPPEYVGLDNDSERRYAVHGFSHRHEKVDHFGWHPDGVMLRKSADKSPVYSQKIQLTEPLSEKSPLFLELHLQTEVAKEYRYEPALRHDAVVVPCQVGSGIKAYIAFAGLRYPLADYLSATKRLEWTTGPQFQIGNFRGGIMFTPWQADRIVVKDRARGTVLGLRFRLNSGVFVHQTFIFI